MTAPVSFTRTTLTDNDTLDAAGFNAQSAVSATVRDAAAGQSGVMPDTTTAAGLALVTAADAAAQRTALGLGTMATQAKSAVDITGGNVKAVLIGATGTGYTPGDTTPSVAGISYMSIANAGATTITQFDDGIAGQRLVLTFSDANTTISRANAYLAGGVNFVSSNRATLELIYDGTNWIELSRGTPS